MHMCKKCIPCCCSPHIHQLTGKNLHNRAVFLHCECRWQSPAYPDGDAASWFIQRTLMVIHRLTLLLFCSCYPVDLTQTIKFTSTVPPAPSVFSLAPFPSLPPLVAPVLCPACLSQSTNMHPLSLRSCYMRSPALPLFSHWRTRLEAALCCSTPASPASRLYLFLGIFLSSVHLFLSASERLCLRPSSPGLQDV